MLRSSTIRWRWLHKTLIFSLVLDISFRFLIFFAAAADVAAFERSLLLQFKQSVSDPGGLLSGWTPTDSLSVACGVGLTLSTSEMPEKETPERMTPPNPPPPPPFKLILGSSSMPRRQLLAEMGYQFTLMSADIDEKGIRREKPEELVMALAEAKADAIISKLQITDYKDDIEPTLLITADQVVVYEGVIREKPSSKDEARLFVKGYSGSHTSTVGSVLVTNLKTGVRRGAWDKAEVHFHDIPDEVIEELIEEGVVLHVAGGLLLENPLISRFVEAVVGTADSVMGLPKELTEKLIQEAL